MSSRSNGKLGIEYRRPSTFSTSEPEMEPDGAMDNNSSTTNSTSAKLALASQASSAPQPPSIAAFADPKKELRKNGSIDEGSHEDIEDANSEQEEEESFQAANFQADLQMDQAKIEAVRATWHMLLKKVGSMRAVGSIIYDAVFEVLPALSSVFISPKAVQAIRFATSIDRLVTSLHQPRQMRHQVETIAFLHSNFKQVDSVSTRAFRTALVDLMALELAEDFTDIAKEGWIALLKYIGSGIRAGGDVYFNHVHLISHSWKKVTETKVVAADQSQSGSSASSSSSDGGELGVSQTFVPTTYPEMFDLNCQVMGFDSSSSLREIVDSFGSIVSNLFDVRRVQEECEMLALRIAKHTSGAVAFAEYKACMLASLRSLLPKEWSSAHEVAWSWLWEHIERLLMTVLGKPAHWEAALDRFQRGMDEVEKFEMRKSIYNKFFELEKAGQDFFKQSNTRLHYIAGRVMEMTLEILREPKVMVEQLSALGLRHVGYGLYPSLLGPYVTGSIDVVSSYAKSKYNGTEEVIIEAYAWTLTMIAKILARVIREGSTIVMKAIEVNTEKSLWKAISTAPRGQRAMQLLRVQVGTQRISPLVWAIECGRLEAATAIIKDLLTIRADREKYYYGVDALFEEHPDIVARLGEDAPTLLPILFEGLVWRARHTKDGWRRVNYYVKHLVVGPQGGVSNTLKWLHDLQDPKIISHPVVSLVSDQLWTGIVKRQFILSKVWFIFSLLMFMLSQCILPNLDHAGELDLPVRIAIGVGRSVNYVLSMGGMLVLHLKRIGTAILTYKESIVRVWGLPVPKYLLDTYDLGSFLLMVLLVTMLTQEPLVYCLLDDTSSDEILSTTCESAEEIEFRYAILAMCAMFIHWMLLIDLAVFSTSLSAFVLVCGHVLSEIGRFLVALGFLLLTFGSAISVLPTEKEWMGDLVSASTALFAIIVRLYDDDYRSVEDEPALLMAIFGFVTASTVMLLNLLIAQLNCSYEFVYQDMVGFARLNRASIIVEVLGKCRDSQWQRFVDSLKLDQPLEFNEGDVGIPGGIQVLEPANLHPTMVDAIHRFGGSTSPDMQWPEDHSAEEQEEDKLKRIEQHLALVLKRAACCQNGEFSMDRTDSNHSDSPALAKLDVLSENTSLQGSGSDA